MTLRDSVEESGRRFDLLLGMAKSMRTFRTRQAARTDAIEKRMNSLEHRMNDFEDREVESLELALIREDLGRIWARLNQEGDQTRLSTLDSP